jgi:hypothetical protein
MKDNNDDDNDDDDDNNNDHDENDLFLFLLQALSPVYLSQSWWGDRLQVWV